MKIDLKRPAEEYLVQIIYATGRIECTEQAGKDDCSFVMS
jgi:hypothetical protein